MRVMWGRGTNTCLLTVISIQKESFAEFMMSNWNGPRKTQKTSMQKMSNSNMSTQKKGDLHVCYTDERDSKRVTINACSMKDSELKKKGIVVACSTDDRRPKSVHKNGYKR